MPAFQFEACVDSVYSALQAEKGGAARLELCSGLSQGGITPSYGLIKTVKELVRIPIVVLIRPRGGDFCYTEAEIKVICEDVRMAGQLGAQGIAFGALTRDGGIHLQVMKTVMDLSRSCSLSITFHRAFDATRDPLEALEVQKSLDKLRISSRMHTQVLVELGIPRLLTSGQGSSVTEGIPVLKRLLEKSGNKRVSIMPGGGVNEANAAAILRALVGVTELHGSASSPVEGDRSAFANASPDVERAMTGGHRLMATDCNKVAKIVSTCSAVLA